MHVNYSFYHIIIIIIIIIIILILSFLKKKIFFEKLNALIHPQNNLGHPSTYTCISMKMRLTFKEEYPHLTLYATEQWAPETDQKVKTSKYRDGATQKAKAKELRTSKAFCTKWSSYEGSRDTNATSYI